MDRHWYIAIVANNTEKASADKLAKDYEIFLPAQKVVSIWKDGRRKIREKILIPGKILIRCTEEERKRSLENSFVRRYMVDIASPTNEFGRRQVAIVPDDQIEKLKFILGQEDCKVEIDNIDLKPGEKVRVIRGSLVGLEGEVSEWGTKTTKVFIKIAHLGCANVSVNLDDIERI